jgi:predicted phosphate transport protein (TIGR00153 family)
VFLWRKQESVETKLARYFDHCDACFALAEKAFEIFFERGVSDELQLAVDETHKAESAADDLRREIEYMLYGKALLPDSRGDILGLLETFDKLPNAVETALYVLLSHRIRLPPGLLPQFRDLVRVNTEAYRLVRKCVDVLMTNPKATLHITKEVDHKESESDAIERRLITDIFELSIDPGDKMILKEPVRLVSMISDRAETVADRIGIVAIKRHI